MVSGLGRWLRRALPDRRHRLGEGVRRSALDTRESECETVFSTKRIAERLKHALADTKAFLKRLLHLRVRESRTMRARQLVLWNASHQDHLQLHVRLISHPVQAQ
jgi:DNA polymerase III delta prime subunit